MRAASLRLCSSKFGRRNSHVDQAPLDGGESVDHVAGHQHLQSALAADRAAQGDHRRGAEQADLYSRRGKRRLVGGDGEIARGHQLAARRGGNALHLRDHRLRNGLDARHQLGADVEDLAVVD